MIFIYTLSCPVTGLIKYVGKTNNLQLRYGTHCRDFRNPSKVKSWIKNLHGLDLKPLIECIDEVPDNEWKFWEEYWYWQLSSWGFLLKNDKGILGYGSDTISLATRKKIADSLRGRKNNWPTTDRKVSKFTLKGNYVNTYRSVSEAARDNKCNSSNIHAAAVHIDGQYMSAGFMWRYTLETGNIEPYNVRKNLNIIKAVEKIKKPISCFTLNNSFIKSFVSTKDAERWLNIPNAGKNICANLKGRYKSAYGYKWQYI